MAARDLFGRLGSKVPRSLLRPGAGGLTAEQAGELPDAPLGGTRAEAMQRLQIGVTGLAAVIFLVGLAGIIGDVADDAEQAAVPDAAPTTEPSPALPQRDPLADAGVVPDIAAEPEIEQPVTVEEGEVSATAPDGTVIVPDTLPTDPNTKPPPGSRAP